MKKIFSKIFEVFLLIVAIPYLCTAIIALLVCVPVDCIRYRHSAFYRDTHHKYELLIVNSMWVRLYEIMHRDHLPLDFHLHSTDEDTMGYFRYRDTLLVLDCPLEYASDRQQWIVLCDEEDQEPCMPLPEALALSLEDFHQKTNGSDCRRAVTLANINDISKADRPHLAECSDILPYRGKKDLSRAIKAWIDTMN